MLCRRRRAAHYAGRSYAGRTDLGTPAAHEYRQLPVGGIAHVHLRALWQALRLAARWSRTYVQAVGWDDVSALENAAVESQHCRRPCWLPRYSLHPLEACSLPSACLQITRIAERDRICRLL